MWPPRPAVSYQTVSRVINGHPSVKASTREPVLATISDLGFRPNRAARSLAGGPVNSVTVLTSNTTRTASEPPSRASRRPPARPDFALGIRVMEAGGRIADAVERATEPGAALS